MRTAPSSSVSLSLLSITMRKMEWERLLASFILVSPTCRCEAPRWITSSAWLALAMKGAVTPSTATPALGVSRILRFVFFVSRRSVMHSLYISM